MLCAAGELTSEMLDPFTSHQHLQSVCVFRLFQLLKILFIFLLLERGVGRERERDREEHHCETETLTGRLFSAPRLGIEPVTFRFAERGPTY